ncbi:MAG TPA: S8 family serine peptidase [Vicinamibacterales bacterium]|nr:S8 family serine peptidase [Vicinamibacterales bacterium]
MNSLTLLARTGLALLVGATFLVTTTSSQDNSLGGAFRVLMQDTGLEGIDLGLRAQDMPMREPGGQGTRGLALMQRAEGAVQERLYKSGSVIVKFRSDAGTNGVSSAMREVAASKISRPSYADFDIMEIPADADPEAVSAELRARPDVEYAQPRYQNYPMFRPNDQFYDRQWNFPAIDMERAWDIQPQAGDEITVAVVDSGVAFQTSTIRYNSRFRFQLVKDGPIFPALGVVDVPFAVAPELGAGKFVAPRDFIWDDAMPVDLDGHGTHVSGTVGQLTNNTVGVAGMAFGVRIMPVKVIAGEWDFIFGAPNGGTDDVVARGVRYAADNGAKVINMSIGRTSGGASLVVDDAIRYAISRGVFVAVAAGNSADQGNAPSRTAESAPSIPGMVAVGAVGRSLERAYYSTTNGYVEIAAPGGDQRRDGGPGGILQQTINLDLLHTYQRGPQSFRAPSADQFAYYFFQGTSMATPHVAAFAAMLMQQGITKPAAIEAAMKQFARDLGPAGNDSEYGHGLIQPRTTLRGLGLAR